MNILVVDDDTKIIPRLRGLVEAHFRDLGVLVYHESTLAGGLAMARNRTFSACLLDAVLPCSPKGEETIKSIRKFPCPVIMFSGRSDSDLVQSATEAGAVDFIIKGTPFEEQMAKIERVLTSVQNARVQQKTADIHEKQRGISFTWGLNLGHVLQIVVMAGVLIGIYANLKTTMGVNTIRIDTIEKADIQRDQIMQQMNVSLINLTVQQAVIAEKLKQKDGAR